MSDCLLEGTGWNWFNQFHPVPSSKWKMFTFYIFRETKLSNQINDKVTVKPNIIFETIVHEDPHRGLPAAYSS
jgi:hypothetical protein